MHAAQVGLEEHIKKDFCENVDEIIQGIPLGEKLIIGGDLNDHIGRNNNNYERVHRGFVYSVGNEGGD